MRTEHKMKKKQLLDDEMKRYLEEHFTYEVEMLGISYERLLQYTQTNDTDGRNMALECFCLHTRNLLEFYYKGKRQNYARMHDFLEKDAIPRMNIEFFKSHFDKISKMLHFTYDRIYGNSPEKGWHVFDMISQVFTDTETFLEHLPPKFKGERINKLSTYVRRFLVSNRVNFL